MWTEFSAATDDVAKLETELRLMDMEVEMIDVHRLTLPPQDYPRNLFERGHETRRRRCRLARARVDLNRALLRRFLRRVCTLGL